jgi:hypothetical protein
LIDSNKEAPCLIEELLLFFEKIKKGFDPVNPGITSACFLFLTGNMLIPASGGDISPF